MTQIQLPHDFILDCSNNFQLVVIDNFYDAVNNKTALKWLGKLFQFKVNSYRESYPYGILPFAGTDLVGIHWLFCIKKESGLYPIMGFKTIDTARTDIFRIEFPAYSIVAEPQLNLQRDAIKHEVRKAQNNGYPLGYLGSWTIDPSVRNNLLLSKLCKKMTSALVTEWIQAFDIQAAVTFASLRFHVEKFHTYMGMTRLLGAQGQHLPDFKAHPFFDEPASISILHRENCSLETRQDALDLKIFWNKKIVIGSEDSCLLISPSRDKKAA